MSKIIKTGNPNKPILFCISGMFAGDWVWSKTIEYLEKEYYLYIMKEPLCLIGNSIEIIKNYIYQILEEEDIKDAYFVGNSLGGLIALIIGNEKPNLSSGIIISGAPGLETTNLGIGLPKTPDKNWIKLLLTKNFFDMDTIESIDIAIDKVMSYFESKEAFKNIIRLTKESNNIENFNIDHLLNSLEVPLYAVWGIKDVISPIDAWLPFFDKYNTLYKEIDKAGHSPMFEQEEAFATTLIEFKKYSTGVNMTYSI